MAPSVCFSIHTSPGASVHPQNHVDGMVVYESREMGTLVFQDDGVHIHCKLHFRWRMLSVVRGVQSSGLIAFLSGLKSISNMMSIRIQKGKKRGSLFSKWMGTCSLFDFLPLVWRVKQGSFWMMWFLTIIFAQAQALLHILYFGSSMHTETLVH